MFQIVACKPFGLLLTAKEMIIHTLKRIKIKAPHPFLMVFQDDVSLMLMRSFLWLLCLYSKPLSDCSWKRCVTTHIARPYQLQSLASPSVLVDTVHMQAISFIWPFQPFGLELGQTLLTIRLLLKMGAVAVESGSESHAGKLQTSETKHKHS